MYTLRSALSFYTYVPLRLGVHGIAGRTRFAGMLFRGSVLKEMGTRSIVCEKSNSNQPWMDGIIGSGESEYSFGLFTAASQSR